MYERFTDRARKVMQLANNAARELKHEYIGTEHILLGLIRDEHGVGGHILRCLEVSEVMVRIHVTPGPEVVSLGKLPLTPRVKQVLEYALEWAGKLNHQYIGTEHLLLGLSQETEGLAAEIFRQCNVTSADIRDNVVKLLSVSPCAHSSSPTAKLEPVLMHVTPAFFAGMSLMGLRAKCGLEGDSEQLAAMAIADSEAVIAILNKKEVAQRAEK